MKCVMLSIRPKYCELIASGKKTVEVRKTKPKIDVPFKCYIYETQGRTEIPFVDEDGHEIFKGRGQVIGEFVCDRLIGTCLWRLKGKTGLCAKRAEEEKNLPSMAYLTIEEIEQYAGSEGRGIYGWHITDLVIYDKPKELSEFFSVKEAGGYEEFKVINRPPQSWFYCEKIDAKPLVEGKTITIPKWEYKE